MLSLKLFGIKSDRMARRAFLMSPFAATSSTNEPVSSPPGHGRTQFHKFRQWKKQKESQEKRLHFKRIVEQAFAKTPSRFQLVDVKREKEASQPWSCPTSQPPLSVLALSKEIADAVMAMKISVPTEIQKLAIPLLLCHSSVLVAAETGSGKTLAYLLPLAHRLKMEEHSFKPTVEHMAPRAVILVPSRELVQQTLKVAKTLCQHVKLKACAISPGMTEHKVKEIGNDPFDILITVPSLFITLLEKKRMLSIERLRHFVVDEADTLLDSEFGADMKSVFESALRSVKLKSLAIVSATITRPMERAVAFLFPNIVKVTTDRLHMTSESIRQRFYRMDKPGNAKAELLEQLLLSEPTSRIMVFCNSQGIATRVHDFLIEPGRFLAGKIELLHGGLDDKVRDAALDRFQSTRSNILVCTDLAARGIDCYNVNHVVMYDFPHNAIDYLHRAGRTGRAGKGGRVTCFVTRRDEPLLKFIQASLDMESVEGMYSYACFWNARIECHL